MSFGQALLPSTFTSSVRDLGWQGRQADDCLPLAPVAPIRKGDWGGVQADAQLHHRTGSSGLSGMVG